MPWNEPLRERDRIAGEKRDVILKEAARAFNQHGFRGTNLDEVARRLGITKPVLYYYFKDKEDLLLACHQLSIDLAFAGVERARAGGKTAAARLEIALAHLIEGLTDELNGTVMLLERGALSPAKEKTLIRKRDAYEKELRAMVEEGMAGGEFVKCDPAVAVFTMLGSVNWLTKWYSAKGKYSSEDLGRMISRQLLRGLLVSPPNESLL